MKRDDFERWHELEAERNSLLAVIAEKDKALSACVLNDIARKALALTPENVRLVPKAWMAMSGSFEMIASTKNKLPDQVADSAIQLYTIETIEAKGK